MTLGFRFGVSYKMNRGNSTYQFNWTLELSEQPWPSSVKFPSHTPRVFYALTSDTNAPIG